MTSGNIQGFVKPVCHICTVSSEEDDCIHIFGDKGKRENLSEKICNYTPFKVDSSKDLSALICSMCVTNINSWDEYIGSCLKAQNALKSYTSNENNNVLLETSSHLPAVHNVGETDCVNFLNELPNRSSTADSTECGNKPKLRTTYCIAKWCNNNTGSSDKHISFFRIPKDVNRAQQWLRNASREDLLNSDMKVLHTKYLCEEHFSDRMFMNERHNRLIWTAVPTIFQRRKTRNSSSFNATKGSAIYLKRNENHKIPASEGKSGEKVVEKSEKQCSVVNSEDFKSKSTGLDHQVDVKTEDKQNLISTVTNNDSLAEATELFMGSDVSGCLNSSEVTYPCGYCGEVFLVESSLIVHQTTYHPGHSVGCDVCGLVEYHSKGEFLEHACSVTSFNYS